MDLITQASPQRLIEQLYLAFQIFAETVVADNFADGIVQPGTDGAEEVVKELAVDDGGECNAYQCTFRGLAMKGLVEPDEQQEFAGVKTLVEGEGDGTYKKGFVFVGDG